MDIHNIMTCIEYLETIENDSVDFILTDPPYITSKETGMDNFKKMIDENKEAGIEFVKTEEEWESVKDNFKDKFSEFSD